MHATLSRSVLSRTRLIPLLVFGALFLTAAAPAAVHAQSFKVSLTQIKASNTQTPSFDKRIKAFERQLKQYPYNTFKLASNATKSGQNGQTIEFPLDGGGKLQVTPTASGDRVAVRIVVYRGGRQILQTTLKLKRGGTGIVSTPLAGGARLFLPITVR
jgi:hypothetical protein